MKKPIERIQIKNQHISERETAIFCRIVRFPLEDRVYRISQSSVSRIISASRTRRTHFWNTGWAGIDIGVFVP